MAQKVLVVDDQPELRRLLQLSLQHGGFDVVQTDNGEDCLSLVEQEHPAVVVLDVMMPGRYDGFEVCELLKRKPASPAIILLTARVQDADRSRGLQVGADRYITKPFSPMELISLVRELASEH